MVIKMNENRPIISVVTVAFNEERNIERTILSVLSQNYKGIELVVVDGASTDKTLSVVKKYQDKISAIISEKDGGIYDAMNKGVKYCQGDYVVFMNAGDVFYSDAAVSAVVDKSFGSGDLVYGGCCVTSVGGLKRIKKNPVMKVKPKKMFICHQAMFAKRKFLLQNPFDLKYKIASDFDFLHKCIKSGGAESVNVIVCDVALGGVSDVKWRDTWAEYREIYSRYEKITWLDFFYYSMSVRLEPVKRMLSHFVKKYL